MKKIPLRTCIITKEKHEKKDLIRIVRTPDGKVEIDLTNKKNGKGAYITKDITVIEKAKKNNALGKALEVEIPVLIYEELKELINK